jgi:hypothetical protein
VSRWFLPSVRRGFAGALSQPDPLTSPLPPVTLQPTITLADSQHAEPPFTAQPAGLQLLGPESVVALGPEAIVRRDPAPNVTDAEESMLASVELTPADLPWAFTPAAADDRGRVRPWLVLIVVEQSTSTLMPGAPTTITAPLGELPDLSESYAWAHVQVMLDPSQGAGTAEQAAATAAELGSDATARILCLRRLMSGTAYIACLVPAFLVGRQAGLGQPVDDSPAPLQPAWPCDADAGGIVTLPVYDSWSFTTSPTADFPALAGRLAPLGSVPEGFGTRSIDVSRPFLDSEASEPETVALGGALGLGDEPPETWDGQEAFVERLVGMLDDPARWRGVPAPAGSDSPPQPDPPGPVPDETGAVAPPIYGARYAGADYVPTDTASWLYQLNLSARYRTIAGYGVRYVQEHRDFLLTQAWGSSATCAPPSSSAGAPSWRPRSATPCGTSTSLRGDPPSCSGTPAPPATG